MELNERTQVAVRLPEPMARKLKSIAALEGRTLQEIFESAANEYVSAHLSGQAQETAEGMAQARGEQG